MINYNINNKVFIHTSFFNKSVYQIWLSTVYGEVLLKNILPNKKVITIKDLTIENESSAFLEAKDLWGIDFNLTELIDSYSFETTINNIKITIHGLLLERNLNYNQKALISRNADSNFTDYRNIDDILISYYKDDNFKESYYSILKTLDDRYGFKPTLVAA